MKALKRLTAEQQQSPLVKDIEREYQKEKEKENALSELKRNRFLSIAYGVFALVGGLGTVNAVMNGQVEDAKMIGCSTFGMAMLAGAGVKGLKNTVYSLENKAILNVIKPYLDRYEENYVDRNTIKSENRDVLGGGGSAVGFLSAGTSYLSGLTTLDQSAVISCMTIGASLLAEEVVKAGDIKENHRVLSDKVRYLVQKGRC